MGFNSSFKGLKVKIEEKALENLSQGRRKTSVKVMLFANLGGEHDFASRDTVTPSNRTWTFRRNVVPSKLRYPIA